MEYLHTMVRVRDIEASLRFYCGALGLIETRRSEHAAGRFTLIFLAAPGDVEHARQTRSKELELTHNWDDEAYGFGRNFGHLAYRVDDIFAACARIEAAGYTVHRPPRDGRMAFIKSPDGISVELLQRGEPLVPAEPWLSRPNVGTW